ncbi:MAG: TonB-dependent receptor [Opitutaceae bacterium]|nr:TonB-dependent receptor [Opitutaceae bacterium]
MNFRSLILFTSLPAAALLAQDDAHFVQLERLDVTADRPLPLTVPSVEAAAEALKLTPGGIETIDASRWLRGRASTVDDTFALSPGVIALSRFGSDEARLSIRGSGLQRTFHGRGIRVSQDGVPINLADGGFDMQALEPLAADYINIWRGGNALASGASTLGGAIDYVSRTGRHASPFSARIEMGAWNYLRANLSGGGASGDFDAYASLTHQAQSGFRDHAKQSNLRLFANTGWRITKDWETRFYLTAVRTDSELPGNLTKAQLAADATQAAAGNLALNQKRDFDLLRLANKTTLSTGDTVWDFSAAWTYKDLDHPIFQVIDQLSNDLLLGVIATHSGEFAGRAHRLRAGLLHTRGVTQAANFANIGGRRGARLAASDQTAINTEGFVESQLDLGRGIALVLGASASDNRRKHDQTFGGNNDYALRYDRVMPKVGLRWNSDDMQVFANVSGSYEPPSFSETLTLNTARDAQTATSWEIGTRGFRGPVRWDVTAYHAALRHELLTLDHDNNPATAAATINADATSHAGVEAAFAVDLLGGSWGEDRNPSQRLVLRGAWTYGDFRFDDDPRYGDNTLAGLPPHLIRAELTWENRHGWYAGPTVQWAPRKTYIDFRNTYAADGYAIYGFRLGRQSAKGVSWFAEVRNLSDQTYVATTGVIENANGIDQAQFLPGDGRGFFAGISFAY